MIIRDAALIIDDRQTEYEVASVALFQPFLKISRVKQGHLGHWFIRDPGPHFFLGITPDIALSALEAGSFEHHQSGHDLGQMYWYGGASGRDGTGCRGVSSLDLATEILPGGKCFNIRICGSLVDKEQIIFGALPPPPHRTFDLSMSFPLDNLAELFDHCPDCKGSVSEVLARR